MGIQTGLTVRKQISWVMTCLTLTFDLWPWPFAWTSLLWMVIAPENFVMIRWWEHNQKGVMDKQTDGRTDLTIHRAAWSQLKRLTDRQTDDSGSDKLCWLYQQRSQKKKNIASISTQFPTPNPPISTPIPTPTLGVSTPILKVSTPTPPSLLNINSNSNSWGFSSNSNSRIDPNPAG